MTTVSKEPCLSCLRPTRPWTLGEADGRASGSEHTRILWRHLHVEVGSAHDPRRAIANGRSGDSPRQERLGRS